MLTSTVSPAAWPRVVDLLETVAVDEQYRQLLAVLAGIAQRPAQAAFEEGAVGQAGQTVVVGLVRQRGVLVLQARLPGFEFVEQGVEVLAQLAQLGDAGFRYALLEIPFAAHGMRDLRQLVERADDTAYQPP